MSSGFLPIHMLRVRDSIAINFCKKNALALREALFNWVNSAITADK